MTALNLVNADTGAVIMKLVNGITLDLAKLPTRRLGVAAEVGAGAESVRFGLDGNANYRTENNTPFALTGDLAGGKHNPWTPTVGTHTLTATAYSLDNAAGLGGVTLTVRLTVTDSAKAT